MNGITKQEAQKFLGNAPDASIFWCRDGRSISNLKQLGDTLAKMDMETYYYHANPGGKNFSDWVKDVVGDQKLATELRNAQNSAQASAAVSNRVDLLENVLRTQ